MNSCTADNDATSVALLKTDEQSARRVADIFTESFTADDVAASLVDSGDGRWRVTIHFCAAPDESAARALAAAVAGDAAAALRFERIAATDWVRQSLAGLAPVATGRFIVHGAHDRARIPPNRIGIEIEAALAFGTGHHGTTRGCLIALDRICKSLSERRRPQKILDVGAGTGVLAIAAARALRRPVLAIDIDNDAVRAAGANARLNRAGALVEVLKANGVTTRRVRARGRCDLVFANILLRPLQRLAAPLTRLTAPGARVVLSGLLPSQANAALAAYHRLTLERRIVCDGWMTLILRRGR
ncbi:MAG TPA: 50S ribosomal protein L11 methyltransferase [Xanthobacteraceae bacterium]|nr:50S ribosomal protein L11 methyltransferase [Xanthobacteraceae bacterium]